MEKHRNLSYQEQLLEDINRAEQDKFEVPEKLILDLIRSVLHFVCVHTLASTASFKVILTRDFNYPFFFVQILSGQQQFSQNFHLRENALIFYQILPTNSFRKCMEISLENFYVDIVA